MTATRAFALSIVLASTLVLITLYQNLYGIPRIDSLLDAGRGRDSQQEFALIDRGPSQHAALAVGVHVQPSEAMCLCTVRGDFVYTTSRRTILVELALRRQKTRRHNAFRRRSAQLE